MSRFRNLVKIADVDVAGTHVLFVSYAIKEEVAFATTVAQVATAAVNGGVKQCDIAFVYSSDEPPDPYIVGDIEDPVVLQEYMIDEVGAKMVRDGKELIF